MAITNFEEDCHYYRSFDLGMAIVCACRNRQGISFQKARQFLRDYQNDITLELVERKSLKAFAVYLFSGQERQLEFINQPFAPNHSQQHRSFTYVYDGYLKYIAIKNNKVCILAHFE